MASLWRSLLLVLSIGILSIAAVACGGDDDDDDGTATQATGTSTAGSGDGNDEGTLTLYSGRSESLVQGVIDMFEAETGINVEVKYAGTTELAALLIEEGDGSPADVFFAQDGGALGAIGQAGLFETLPEATLSKVAETYRADDGTWVGISGRSRVLAYNTDMVSTDKLPTSYRQLTEPNWEGKVGWAPTNASFQTFITAVREIDGEEAAENWIEAMKANGVREYPNNVTIVDAVAAGEIEVGLVNHYYLFGFLADHGDGFKARNHYFAGNDAGSLVNVAGVGILKNADHKDLAQQFVDFLLSEEAQAYFAEETHEYPLVAGVPTDERLKPLDELDPPDIDLSNLDDLEGTVALLQRTGVLP